jgi:hypothetical protein
VGEKIVLPTGEAPYIRQLENTLCFSMTCVAPDHPKNVHPEGIVSGKLIKSKTGTELELQLRSPSGAMRTSVKVPATATGHLSPTDVVTATSAIIKELEAKEILAEEKEKDPANAARMEKEQRAQKLEQAKKAKQARTAKVMKKKKAQTHLASL